MIESAAGDILKADADALVNPVNCEGETGRGLALQFKKRFPANFNAYYEACRNNIVELGQMFLFETKSKSKPFYIINFPIKQYWRDPVTLETIQAGLIDLAQIVQQHQIMTVAMPPIGCGQGGLHWKSVRPLLEQYLDSEERHFVIYGFSAPPMHKAPTRPPGPPLMTVGRAALVRLMALYTNSINDNHVTLPELHMLLFLLQEAGETLRLEFNKGSASPYARNLRRVLNALDGYYISGYIGGPDRPSKELQIIPSIEESVADFLEKYPATVGRIEKVLQLCDDFPPHSGLELLTTTLWIVTREQCYTLEDVIRRTYGWNRQKRQFSSEQISSAANRLAESGWIRPLAPEAPYTSEYNAEPPWANDPISNTKQF